MLKKALPTVLSLFLFAIAGLPALSAETGTMICKGGIVSIGDTAGEVNAKCGEPATRSTREEKRVSKETRTSHERIITTITIDDWIFNFGPNEFQYRLILENSRVADIESLDYGY